MLSGDERGYTSDDKCGGRVEPVIYIVACLVNLIPLVSALPDNVSGAATGWSRLRMYRTSSKEEEEEEYSQHYIAQDTTKSPFESVHR